LVGSGQSGKTILIKNTRIFRGENSIRFVAILRSGGGKEAGIMIIFREMMFVDFVFPVV